MFRSHTPVRLTGKKHEGKAGHVIGVEGEGDAQLIEVKLDGGEVVKVKASEVEALA